MRPLRYALILDDMAGSWIIFDAPPSTDELLCTAEQARAQKRARKLPPFEWNEAVLSVTVAPVVQPDEHTVTAFDFVTNEPVDVAACTFEESQSTSTPPRRRPLD